MNRIAVDVILLPDGAIARKAIKANTQLVKQYGSHIALNASDCLPHISLAMGCMNTGDIDALGQTLRDVATACPTSELAITGIATTLNAKGQHVSSFILAITSALQQLHERVMAETKKYFSYDVAAEMICGDEPAAETTLSWIRHYPEHAAFGAFFPHITLGYGMVTKRMTFPMSLRAKQLAVCHLGNHCTCRKILSAVKL